MRSEEEVRSLYKKYVFKYAEAALDNPHSAAANQYFGAAIASGRTLGKDVRRIKKDFEIAKEHYRREKFKN